jgi:hypothetical protein
MGIYDTYGNLEMQMKVGDVCMNRFSVGDKVHISDGVYLCYEGVLVIKDGIFIAEFEYLLDKRGWRIPVKDLLDSRNPLNIALLEREKALNKEECKCKNDIHDCECGGTGCCDYSYE